jgi:hypothetical protein
MATTNKTKKTTGEDVIVGTPADDKIVARGGDDVVDGGEGNDILIGGAGFDLLFGGHGNDQMYGGSGDDLLMEDESPFGSGDDKLGGPANWPLAGRLRPAPHIPNFLAAVSSIKSAMANEPLSAMERRPAMAPRCSTSPLC